MSKLSSLLAVLALLVSTNVLAGPIPYSQAAFDQLIKEGKPVLVHVHADWCPTCRAQDPIIDSLLKQKGLEGITLLRVNFDDQKPVLRSFNVRQQSTLIVFKAGKEVGRSTGDTTRDGIERLLQKTL